MNPDFSQVEADAGQIDVNRRYALFFPEKRPFFLEGRDSFNYPGADYSPMQSVVHTRTIVNPIAGAKLTGKLGAADTLASIYAVDEQPDSAVDAGSPDYAQVAVVRYKRSLAGDSYLGGFYTGREEGDAFNRVYGGDASLRVTQASALGFYAFGSSTRPHGRGHEGRPLRARQLLPRQPEDEPVSPGARHLAGVRHLDGVCLPHRRLPGIDASSAPRFYPKSAVVRRVEPRVVVDYVRDAPSGLWEQWYEGSLSLVLAALRPA